jgi:hypothetical protein
VPKYLDNPTHKVITPPTLLAYSFFSLSFRFKKCLTSLLALILPSGLLLLTGFHPIDVVFVGILCLKETLLFYDAVIIHSVPSVFLYTFFVMVILIALLVIVLLILALVRLFLLLNLVTFHILLVNIVPLPLPLLHHVLVDTLAVLVNAVYYLAGVLILAVVPSTDEYY